MGAEARGSKLGRSRNEDWGSLGDGYFQCLFFFFGITGGKEDGTRRNCTLATSHSRQHRSSRPMPLENYDRKSATRDVK